MSEEKKRPFPLPDPTLMAELNSTPKNIGELIDHLKQFDPEIELATSGGSLSFRLCRWKPRVNKMVPDPYVEGAFTFLRSGDDSKETVNLLVIG